MSKHISYNGEIIPSKEPCLSYNNRGLVYGDSFSVELRGNSSKPYLFDQYYDYISSALRYLKLTKTDFHKKEVLENDIFLLLQKNRIYKGFKARITFFRNYSPDKIATINTASFIISTEALPDEVYTINETGYTILVYPNYTIPDYIFLNNYVPSFNPEILSYPFLKNNNVDEAIITDSYGNLIKSLHSNIFLVKNNRLLVPEKVPNDYSKIYFDFVIATARRLNIKIIRFNSKEINIKNFDEIFLANIIDGVKWVSAYKDKRFFNQISHKIAKEINYILY